MIEFDLRIYQVSIPVWFDWEDGTVDVEKLINSFQFQYGSIGRAVGKVIDTVPVGFNSSMVRLGVSDSSTSCPIFCCFNSSMVRLGGGRAWVYKTLKTVFQFQYGSIGRSGYYQSH